MSPQQPSALCDEYLNGYMNPSSLGFLSIFIGGSASRLSSSDSIANFKSDWDGVGIVARKEDIVSLISSRRSELSELLKIETEDGSMKSWEGALQKADISTWDIVRFSGWTSNGSKRTLKIWSQESFCMVMASKATHVLGMLTHKTVQHISRNHPECGPELFIFQSTVIADNIYSMPNFDFGKPSVIEKGPMAKTWPGAVCDLLLTAKCLFEVSPGLGATQKAAVWSKWSAMNGANSYQELLPWLYRWKEASPTDRAMMTTELESLNPHFKVSNRFSRRACPGGDDNPGNEFILCSTSTDSTYVGCQALRFEPVLPQPWQLDPATAMDVSSLAGSQIPTNSQQEDFTLHPEKQIIYCLFSQNSACEQGLLRFASSSVWIDVFAKTADNFVQELLVLPNIRRYFPQQNIQKIVAVDAAAKCLYYDLFRGKSLLEIRLLRNKDDEGFKFKDELMFQLFLLSIESRRAQDIMRAYHLSYLPASALVSRPEIMQQQKIHQYFYYRVRGNARLNHFYSQHASFLDLPSGKYLPLERFLDMPLRINGMNYQSLGKHFAEAMVFLHPEAKHFKAFPLAFGLGDGHGGNLMVGDPVSGISTPLLRYIDYEISGWHPFVLDLAKPLYLDCFSSLFWADLSSEDLHASPAKDGPHISWKIGDDIIEIEYDVQVGFLDKGLAITKLEYIVRPVFEMLTGVDVAPALLSDVEKALAYALFCCAVLTRNFSTRADCWFLNLAVGVRLAGDMKGAFDEFFGWRRWPGSPPDNGNGCDR